jgi:hypothetical protein
MTTPNTSTALTSDNSEETFDSGNWMNAIQNLEASNPEAIQDWNQIHEGGEETPTIEEFAEERGIELDYTEVP